MEANIGSEPLRRHMRFFVRMEEKCRNNGVRDFSEEKSQDILSNFSAGENFLPDFLR